MSALKLIRTNLLGMNQRELAAVTKVSQATVSRWEKGELAPSTVEMSKIIAEAKRRGKKFNEAWFFDPRRAERDLGPKAKAVSQ